MNEIVLEKLKVLLQSCPSIALPDEILEMVVEREIDNARGYCNREKMPEESATVIAFMCLDDLKDAAEKSVSSVSEAGSSVSFGNLTSAEIRNEHKKALNAYRIARAV